MQRRLAGKEAEFAVTAKSIEAPGEVKVDDEFANRSVWNARQAARSGQGSAARETFGVAPEAQARAARRTRQPPQIDPPPSMVEEEFNRVWISVTDELKNENKTFADENTTEEKAKEEYQAIAARRVRLGLVLAEIGEKNNST